MRIPTWRLALTGGAVAILVVVGIGFVAASTAPPAPAANVTTTEVGASTAHGERAGKAGHGWRGARLFKAGKHLVHAELTVTDKDGNLVNLQLDHGTVATIGGGSLTITEAGGSSETVSTNDATIVRVGREKGALGDITVGAEVFVQSRVDGSAVLAKRILVIPARS